MLPSPTRGVLTPAQRATHPAHLVRHNCFPVSRSAEHDPPLAFALHHCLRRRPHIHRIIHRLVAARPKICHFVTASNEPLLNPLFIQIPCVIRSQCNSHRASAVI